MESKEFEKRIKKHEVEFEKIWQKIVEDTNNYIEKNPKKTMYNLSIIERFSDNLCLSGAWVQDRINGLTPSDKKSLTKKIRKALNYTYP